MATCLTCRGDWERGEFSQDCAECGGGALEIACPMCHGQCGGLWRRAVIDSNDSGMGHFVGSCRLDNSK